MGVVQKYPMWEKVRSLVSYLRQQGLRVDGLGWQAHVDVGWEKKKGNIERFGKLIDWTHSNNLSFHVTEANVWLKGKKDYEAQAKTFEAILKILLEKRENGVVTWNVWNISDGQSWKKNWKDVSLIAITKPNLSFAKINPWQICRENILLCVAIEGNTHCQVH
ncbi:MAG: endo-1,4-beta-xylanase [Bacteroidetes bacterium]|nr:endo-1,4-beta-xylanase [Bacteroidota bacterium]